MADLPRRLAAEAFGTALLVAAVVGSGIMAERLTGDAALALLCNAVATGAILVVLISILGPISGAHFNPAVTLVLVLRRQLSVSDGALYAIVQGAGAIGGTLLSHAMFALPLIQQSSLARSGAGQWLAESVAAFGLVATILLGRRDNIAWLVGLYIAAGYWFTASTSFANPAVTLARTLTDTFSGIRPIDAPAFIMAQVAGALMGLWAIGWLLAPAARPEGDRDQAAR